MANGRKARGESLMLDTEEKDFRTHFVREPAALKQFPALVLNADYRPLTWYPLSLWPWQEAIKAVVLDRVAILAEYDEVVRSQRAAIRRTMTEKMVVKKYDPVNREHVEYKEGKIK